MMKRLFISILILLWASTALAQLVMEVLPLKHSRPNELVPAIKGILDGQENVVVIQNKLVVRATPRKLAQIKSLLKQIDTPLQNLRITVRQGLRQDIEKQDSSVSADVAVGNSGRISVGPNRGASGGANVTARSGNSSLGGHFSNNNLAERDLVSQQILTLEGRPAIIHVTQSVPTRVIRKGHNAQGKYQEEVTVFRDASIGFSVIPRLVGKGDDVILEVSPEHSKFKGSRVETHGAHTTVSGKLGEWIEIGGMGHTESLENRGILADSKIKSRENRTIFLKVEKTK
jgi:hypothetical protein